MATYTGWSVDGTKLWSDTADIPKVDMDYIGNSQYIGVNDTAMYIFRIASKAGGGVTVDFEKSLLNFSGDVNGHGVAVDHSYMDNGYQHGRDGLAVYVARQVAVGNFDISRFHYQNHLVTTRWQQQMINLGTIIPAGMCFNGKDLFVRAQGGEGIGVRHYHIATGTAQLVKTYGSTGDHASMTFDGRFYWSIGTVNVRGFSAQKWTGGNKIFAHGLSGVKGICTDGHQLITSSD